MFKRTKHPIEAKLTVREKFVLYSIYERLTEGVTFMFHSIDEWITREYAAEYGYTKEATSNADTRVSRKLKKFYDMGLLSRMKCSGWDFDNDNCTHWFFYEVDSDQQENIKELLKGMIL